jgi:putative ABC transport system permease protein
MGLNVTGLSEIPVVLTEYAGAEDFDALNRSILASVESLPDVEAAALSTQMPHFLSGFMERVRPAETPDAEPTLAWGFGVTPGWFELFGIPATRGRTLQNGDWAARSPRPVVITAAFAQSQFGGIEVVGRRLLIGTRNPEAFEIVGIVADTYGTNELDEPRQAFFVTPGAQLSRDQLVVFARTDHFDPQVADRLRDAVGALLPDVPLERPTRLSKEIDIAHREQRILSRLLFLLSGLATLLSAVGLYGVVTYDVAGRRREFGIRTAVGAEARDIVRLVARHASAIVLLGSLFGLGGAYTLSRILESRLFRVAALDPASYVAAAGLLALATAAACFLPTLRATRVDPVTTLKAE